MTEGRKKGVGGKGVRLEGVGVGGSILEGKDWDVAVAAVDAAMAGPGPRLWSRRWWWRQP